MADSAVHVCKTAMILAKLKDQMSLLWRGRKTAEILLLMAKKLRNYEVCNETSMVYKKKKTGRKIDLHLSTILASIIIIEILVNYLNAILNLVGKCDIIIFPTP